MYIVSSLYNYIYYFLCNVIFLINCVLAYNTTLQTVDKIMGINPQECLPVQNPQLQTWLRHGHAHHDVTACLYIAHGSSPEEARHACTNLYKYSASSGTSCDNIDPVHGTCGYCACMSNLLWFFPFC